MPDGWGAARIWSGDGTLDVAAPTRFDDFDRVLSGLNWGDSSDGHTWIIDSQVNPLQNPTISVDGNEGIVECNGNQETEPRVIGPGPWSIGSDFTMTVRLYISASTGSGLGRGVLYGLGEPSEPANFFVGPDSTLSNLTIVVGGATFDAATIPYTNAAYYRLKWQHMPGSAVSRAKAWLDGDAEPGSWAVTRDPTTDSYAGQTDEFSVFISSPSGNFVVRHDWIGFA